MTTLRTVAVLTMLTLVGCHKKATQESAEAGTDNGEGGNTLEAGATYDGAAEAATDDAADSSTSSGGGEAGTDMAGGALPEAGPTSGSGYAGSYNCFGTLTLRQTNNTVSGNAEERHGSTTHSTDFSCQIVGDRCSGTSNAFLSINGMQPKQKGRGKVTFRVVNGGLDYTEVLGGNTQQGFCKRN
jgi:hypothetical protein